MSIIERAIKKMQGDGQPPSRQVFGKLVETTGVPTLTDTAVRNADRMISINQDALRSAGLLAPEHQQRQVANQYRQIKRPLIAGAMGRGRPALPDGRLIMVASAMPGEGKTFTAINLAFSMALERDVQVLLVDADVAKAHISRMFGAFEEPGLMDVLTDPALEVGQCVLATDVEHLSLLPAGTRNEQSTELLASERMTAVMQGLAARDPSCIVVFDSPPLLLTTESQALADVAGQIVLVVRANFTEQHTVMDAISHLPEDVSISLVLNQSVGKSSGGYYYGYGPDSEARPEAG